MDRLVPTKLDGIASGVLLKTANGSATLFAIAEGEGLGEHAASHEALIVVVEGEADVEIQGDSHVVRGDETIRLPAAAPHAVRALTDLRFFLILLHA